MAEFVEWHIKNFSCWSGDVHGEYISHLSGVSRLYPRGLGGKGEHLVVIMEKVFYFGDRLSFIGSDGSVICTQRPDVDVVLDDEVGSVTFTGPKFEEVVGGIRGNEPLHEDLLILRCKTNQWWLNMRMYTEIHAYSVFYQIKNEVFERSGYPWEGPEDWFHVHHIDIRSGYVLPSKMSDRDGNMVDIKKLRSLFPCITVMACTTGATLEDRKVKFKLTSRTMENFLVQTSIWMLNGGNVLQKHEDCFLVGKGDHIIPYEIPLKKLPGLQTVIRCKIVTGQFSGEFNGSDRPISHDFRIKCLNYFPQESQPEKAVTALATDLTYQDPEFPDFEVCRGNVSFPTDQNILSSPVFKAKLSGDMEEKASKGNAEDQVPFRKEDCTTVLAASVSIENVCDILSLADKNQDKELKSVAHDFILKNFNDVLGSKNWEKLILSNPLLVAKTVTDIAKNKGSNSDNQIISPNRVADFFEFFNIFKFF